MPSSPFFALLAMLHFSGRPVTIAKPAKVCEGGFHTNPKRERGPPRSLAHASGWCESRPRYRVVQSPAEVVMRSLLPLTLVVAFYVPARGDEATLADGKRVPGTPGVDGNGRLRFTPRAQTEPLPL